MKTVTCFITLAFVLTASGTPLSRSLEGVNNNPYKVVCYLGSWANYRWGDGKYKIENIDPFLCTHIIYGFAKLDHNNQIAPYDSYLDLAENWGLGAYRRFNSLKKINPQLKTILAIGGWNENPIKYSNMARNPAQRRKFVVSCVKFLLKHGFDGLDMDWEYPANRGGIPEDKENFVILLKELKSELSVKGLLLSAAVSVGQKTVETAYDIPKVAKYLDIINIMAYDFHGDWENKTGHVAPLYERPDESPEDKTLNVDYGVKLWINGGADPKKITMGLPVYGRCFTLKNPNKNGLSVPVTGPGEEGPYTRKPGIMGYNEICEKQMIESNQWTIVRDPHHKVPYMYKDRQWCGYDDGESFQIKAAYIKAMGLGGGMIWSLDTDDFQGKCHGIQYPLLKVLSEYLNVSGDHVTTDLPSTNGKSNSEVTKQTDVPTTNPLTNPIEDKTFSTKYPASTTTVDDDETALKCTKEGWFRFPNDCTRFYRCERVGIMYRIHFFKCPRGTVFSEIFKVCSYPDFVHECRTNFCNMEIKLAFFLVLLLTITAAWCNPLAKTLRDRNSKPYKVVCYLGSWANYRWGDGKYKIEDIDPFICTHLIYGFAKLDLNNKIAAYDPYLDLVENWGLGAFKRFNDLRKINPELTTILAIGGWNEGSVKYSNMARDPAKRKIFIDSCVEFLLNHNFDGLDMDWEYPANRGGRPEDKQDFVTLLKEMKQAFSPHGLLLTAAVSAGVKTIETAYDIPKVSQYLDIVNIMTYDFHGGWDNKTGHNSPLYPRPNESPEDQTFNVDFAINFWIKNGADPKKITMGLPLYGRCFTLSDTSRNGLDAPVNGPGQQGPFTREPGMMGYNELCSNLKAGHGEWTIVRDPHHKVPYMYKDRQWCGYDDAESFRLKTEYIKKMGLGGGMVWSLETDDFKGKCHGQRYPLLTILQEGLNGHIERVTTTSRPEASSTASSSGPSPGGSTQSPQPESTIDDGNTLVCEKEGMFRYPKDCRRFYQCVRSGSSFKIYKFECPFKTVFDTKINACSHPHLVTDC
ncbi:putative chitinase 10 [Tachypleus tridentatus]|uniref:putative chitinase 10 n=1 Tax=Tachypleus tridentatus TaxID=6853 RepID=UPI003FD0A62B